MFISRNIISALLITVMVASVFCIPVLSGSEVDAAAKKVKIKWNANGGKFTAKKYAKKKSYTKKIKKSKKIGTLPKVKRSGYTFKGWYTKKSGGKKVTAKTKFKKKSTVYAQWKKGSSKNNSKKARVLTTEEKKLVGTWGQTESDGSVYDPVTGTINYSAGTAIVYLFEKNGTYNQTIIINSAMSKFAATNKGNWRASGGVIYMTDRLYQSSNDGGKTWSTWKPHATPNETLKYTLGKDEKGAYIQNTASSVRYYNW